MGGVHAAPSSLRDDDTTMTEFADKQTERPSHATLDGSIRCPVEQDGLLAVRGTDAASFLHRQFSSDIQSLAPGRALLTSYSDGRGRVIATPRVVALEDGFVLTLASERLEPVRAQLTKYVLRDDVRIEDVGDAWSRCGIAGQSASIALARAVGTLPEVTWSSTATDDGAHVIRQPGPRPRWLAIGPAGAIRRIWDAVEGHARTAGSTAWRLLEIEAGVPSVHEATAGHFVAQMLNLDRLDALDFHKGCYPGQEVIARTRYLGRIKRRMFILRAEEDDSARPGDDVFANGERIGELVEAAPHPAGGLLALAVLRLEAAALELRLSDAEGPSARADAPPYDLEEAA